MSIENGQFFSPNTWQMMSFLNPLNTLVSKIPFSFFAKFWGRVTSGARGSVSVGFWEARQLSPFWGEGGGASQGSVSTPRPEAESPPPMVPCHARGGRFPHACLVPKSRARGKGTMHPQGVSHPVRGYLSGWQCHRRGIGPPRARYGHPHGFWRLRLLFLPAAGLGCVIGNTGKAAGASPEIALPSSITVASKLVGGHGS